MISNRIEFINALGCSSDFNTFFDKLMSMYDVVNYCVDQETTEISYNTIDNDIQLNLKLSNEHSARELKDNIQNVQTSRYKNQIFKLNIDQQDNIIHIELENRVSV